MENIVKEISTKRPVAWDAFTEWALDNCYEEWGEMTNDYLGTLERYLLADMQSWLDSVGIWCEIWMEGNAENGEVAVKFDYNLYRENGDWLDSVGKHDNIFARFPTREKALYAAVDKGCEIFENNKEK